MLRRTALPLVTVVLALGSLSALASVASADVPTGGTSAPSRPAIAGLTCADGRTGECARGAALTISGTSLRWVSAVTFLGRAGRSDDRTARPDQLDDDAVVVTVPSGTRSGPVVIASAAGRARGPRVRITASAGLTPYVAAEAPVSADTGTQVFPIRGAHDYGTFVNRFGGGRGHKGQDIAAACGTPLVAATAGTVIQATFDGRGGNYAVIQRADGRSEVYMHMRLPAIVRKGDVVTAGQPIGEVGTTGRSSGCHLHFESWTAPGWYRGGRAVDPLPQLRRWDAGA